MEISPLYPSMVAHNTALLVIDIVNSCAHAQCEIPKWGISFERIRRMVPRLCDFIENFRRANSRIIFANITPWTRDCLPDHINELYSDPAASYYSNDASGFPEDFYRVKPQKADLVFTKNQYDAFADGRLEQMLRADGVKYLVITGVFADGCVAATISGAFSCGFNLVILKDLIETTDVPIRQVLKEALIGYTWPFMYGKTVDSEAFMKAFLPEPS